MTTFDPYDGTLVDAPDSDADCRYVIRDGAIVREAKEAKGKAVA